MFSSKLNLNRNGGRFSFNEVGPVDLMSVENIQRHRNIMVGKLKRFQTVFKHLTPNIV